MHLRDKDLMLLMDRRVHMRLHSPIAMEVRRVLSRLPLKAALQELIVIFTGSVKLLGRVNSQISLVNWAQPSFTRMPMSSTFCLSHFWVKRKTFT